MARINEEMVEQLTRDGNFSVIFENGRVYRLEVSTHKYGPARVNFGRGYVSALGSLKKCLDKYEETHNTEYLMDVANYAMFEFMYPSIKGATYRSTDSKDSAGIDGISVKEMEEFRNADSSYLPY